MEIVVIVPKLVYWDAFIRDMRDLWQLVRENNYAFWVGNVRYRMVNQQDNREKYFGMHPDFVIAYNCSPRLDLVHILCRHGAEIVQIWN
jgi:hypothetical protein